MNGHGGVEGIALTPATLNLFWQAWLLRAQRELAVLLAETSDVVPANEGVRDLVAQLIEVERGLSDLLVATK